MTHALQKYWEAAFGRYQSADGKFDIPGFPDPIMSPNFGLDGDYRNVIHDHMDTEIKAMKKQKSFYLGTFKIKAASKKSSYEIISLSKAIGQKTYWELLEDGFPDDIGFLKKLIPFLARQESAHYVGFIERDGQAKAMVTMGTAKENALLINCVVKSQLRHQGMSQEILGLVQYMGGVFKAKTVLYWTSVPGLVKYFERVEYYSIFERTVQ